jgi:hypothetical protein
MKRHLRNLFIPHHRNNHKAKILHHSSLSKLVIFLLVVQVALTFFTRVKPGVLGYASNIGVDEILNLTNKQREGQGLGDLSFNPTLADSARRKASDMFAKNYWAHNAPDGTSPWAFFKQVNYNYLYAGENLARDFNDSTAVVQAWMDSQTHKENIMSPRYSEIGIAVVNGILNGQETTLVVQHFGKPATAVASIPPEAVSVKQAQIKPIPEVAVSEKAENVNTGQNKQPATVYQPVTGLSYPTGVLSQGGESKLVGISTFDITKAVNLALALVILFVLALDGFLIWHRGTVRRSGKSFAHLSFFTIVVLIIILTESGKIM